eukprot:72267-Prymnesium_polylepis.1
MAPYALGTLASHAVCSPPGPARQGAHGDVDEDDCAVSGKLKSVARGRRSADTRTRRVSPGRVRNGRCREFGSRRSCSPCATRITLQARQF